MPSELNEEELEPKRAREVSWTERERIDRAVLSAESPATSGHRCAPTGTVPR